MLSLPRMDDVEDLPVEVSLPHATLHGDLAVPSNPRGVVVFALGIANGRRSPRNRYLAHQLRAAGMATLLVDLLTVQEEAADARDHHLRVDVDMLARRVEAASEYVRLHPRTLGLHVGYFGTSTTAPAAMIAAADRPEEVEAIVCLSGRLELAGTAVTRAQVPTLLIVGNDDPQVIDTNRRAWGELHVEKDLEIVPDAGPMLDEPAALEAVAKLIERWFSRFLGRIPVASH